MDEMVGDRGGRKGQNSKLGEACMKRANRPEKKRRKGHAVAKKKQGGLEKKKSQAPVL